MDGSGIISGLANIVSGSISGTKGVPNAQNNTTALQQFAANTVLRGTVLSRGINNAVTIQTNQGNITIQTDVFLKRGAEIALKIEQRANESFARLISVDGKSLAKYLESGQGQQAIAKDHVATSSKLLNATKADTPALMQGQQSQQASNVQNNTNTVVFRGVFLVKPEIPSTLLSQLPTNIQAGLSQATAGTSLQVSIQNVQVPSASGNNLQPLTNNTAGQTPAQPSPLPVNTAAPASGYALSPAQKIAATTPQIQAALANQQASQAAISTNDDGIELPTQTLPTAKTTASSAPQINDTARLPTQSLQPTQQTTASTSAPTTAQATNTNTQQAVNNQQLNLTATVINNANPRELTLQSEFGTFKLFVTTSLPKGSVVQLNLHNIADVRAGQPQPLENTLSVSRFEAMDSIRSTTHYAPNELVPSPPHIIPRPGPQLSTEMLFLMVALKGGDVRKWLGEDNIKQLDLQGKSQLLGRLSDEFATLKSIPAETRDMQWHHFLMPLASDEKIHQLHFFIKGESHKKGDGSTSDTDHFMVDLELTRLGHMQMDGLIQKDQHTTQFDLIIRTERPWNQELQDDIRQIYMRAQEITGFTGALSFKDAILPLPVDISEQTPSNGRSIIA